ncbi:hypothetical protein Plhal703r1_c15g0073761 [Plasmopara halstedii]
MKRRSFPKTNIEESRRCRIGTSSTRRDLSNKSQAKKLLHKQDSLLSIQRKQNMDLVSRASSDNDDTFDYIAECERLRNQLERVLLNYQRQEEEVEALRTLAKSLKKEVKDIYDQQQLQSLANSSERGKARHAESSNLFTLDVQIEELREENLELRHLLKKCQEQLKSARICIAQKLPAHKLAAIKANAELQCVKSQLQQERAHSDLLERQLVHFKSRQMNDVVVKHAFELNSNEIEVCPTDDKTKHENELFFRKCMEDQDSETSLSQKSSTTFVSDFDDTLRKKLGVRKKDESLSPILSSLTLDSTN